MTKKSMILAAGMLLVGATGAFAQKSKIREANKAYDNALNQITIQSATNGSPAELSKPEIIASLDKALEAANAAIAHPETANNADAWFAKGAILVEMSRLAHYADKKPYMEALAAFKKAHELNAKVVKKPGFENALFNTAIFSFNGGISDINAQNYDGLIAAMRNAKGALTFDNNSLLSSQPSKDTLIAQAEYYTAYGYYLKQDYQNAKKEMEQAIKNPINAANVDAYRILAFSYGETKDFDKQIAIIEAAKKKFPANKDLDADELNYYISQNKTSELLSKFEQAVQREPNNATYVSNLGVLYRNMGMSKDGKFPSDAASWQEKAEAQMKKALELEPNNGIYIYNLASLKLIQADYIAQQMNALGNSKADNIKYDELDKTRIGILKDALASLNKMEALLEPKLLSGKISQEEKGYYFEGLQTLGRVYGALNDVQKAKQYKEKLGDYEAKYW